MGRLRVAKLIKRRAGWGQLKRSGAISGASHTRLVVIRGAVTYSSTRCR